jgi:hypothetical protein
MVHGLFDAGRVAVAAQEIGDLRVARPLALQQDAVEIEDEAVEPQPRSPNKAVPTRTWVAPMVTAVG